MGGDGAMRFLQVGCDAKKGVDFVVVEHAAFSEGSFCDIGVFCG